MSTSCLPRLEPSVARTARAGVLGAVAGIAALACAEKLPPTSLEPGVAVPEGFVRVAGERFVVGERRLPVMGQNYWSAAADSRTPEGRARVARELDRLRAMGVNVLRIMALSEGPDSEPWRVRPSLQPAPGSFTDDGLAGALAGAFPWAWSGEAVPDAPGQLADARQFLGDPPHERQGWYSIYASDATTVALIRRYAARMADAPR